SPRDGMTGATPSAFAVHVADRDSIAEIASQLLAASVDVLIGGNDQAFRPRTAGGTRRDGRNLMKEAQEQGYHIAHQTEELADVPATPFLASLKRACLRIPPSLPLPVALRLLADDPEGFLFVVESEAPDIGGHANNDTLVVDGTYQFDQAVRLTLDFAAREKDTLVLVTADHETGDLSLQCPDSTASYPVDAHLGAPPRTRPFPFLCLLTVRTLPASLARSIIPMWRFASLRSSRCRTSPGCFPPNNLSHFYLADFHEPSTSQSPFVFRHTQPDAARLC
ncbi:MAG TPA: alkaline phosphatase, partial [Rhodothermales bacterium]|nr:alkaline phosphatase [Rhodothermales bacterium]